MTTMDFKDRLTENTFSFGNDFTYTPGSLMPFGLYFSQDSSNYPFILKGGQSNTIELEYSNYSYQLRSRVLNTKKIKEIMNSARLPLWFNIKSRNYLIGKGFLSEYNPHADTPDKILFVACVDGTKRSHVIEQVKFFVCKDVYNEEHKAIQPAIKDLIAGHPGDVVMCKDVLDYIGEKLTLPKGVSLPRMAKYKEDLVKATLAENFQWNAEGPLVVDATFQGRSEPVEIYSVGIAASLDANLPW